MMFDLFSVNPGARNSSFVVAFDAYTDEEETPLKSSGCNSFEEKPFGKNVRLVH